MTKTNFISLTESERKFYVHNFLIDSFTYVNYESLLNCFVFSRLHLSNYSLECLNKLSRLGLDINIIPESGFVTVYIYL